MVLWCHKNDFKQSFIEVMPVGEVNTSRTNQFLPISFAKLSIKKNLGLNVYLFQQTDRQNILKQNSW